MLMKVANVMEKVTGWTIKAPHVPGGDQTEILVFGGLWAMDALTLVYLAIVVVISGVTYRMIEKPGQRLFNTGLLALRAKRKGCPPAGSLRRRGLRYMVGRLRLIGYREEMPGFQARA